MQSARCTAVVDCFSDQGIEEKGNIWLGFLQSVKSDPRCQSATKVRGILWINLGQCSGCRRPAWWLNGTWRSVRSAKHRLH